MAGPQKAIDDRRRLYMLMSPRSLPYARDGLRSLFARSLERLDLALITDSDGDRDVMRAELAAIPRAAEHATRVFSFDDLAEGEATRFGRYPRLRAFRRGHPCWRKITDPLLLAGAGEEMVILDPDLYFPNRFRFEETPEAGVLLMWQKPNCLLPPEIVRRAISAGVRLAHHVDIGVAHWRLPVDLEWLDWLVGALDCMEAKSSMHVEAIVWSAIAMRIGGGHLDPAHWLCWRRTQYKRLRMKLGGGGAGMLRLENLKEAKCFHAGGVAKWWLADAKARGFLDQHGVRAGAGRRIPYVELTPEAYEREQSLKTLLRRMGYYALFPA